MFSSINMAAAKTLVSTAASLAASAMVLRTVTRELIPPEVQSYTMSYLRRLLKSFSSEITLIIEENEGLARNQLYKAAEIYLGTKLSPSTHLYRISLPEKENKICVLMARNQEIVDVFDGVKLKWRQVTRKVEVMHMTFAGQSTRGQTEIRSFQLTFHRKYKDKVLDSYFPFVLNKSKTLDEEKKTLKIYTLNSDHYRRFGSDMWSGVILDHPATFNTLAMESELKQTVTDDLERFVRRKDYYRKVGKAWKRGYLLFGPPGTGKSSLVAAMANHLNFDIYDLQLTDIGSNSDLRRLLINTRNRSILVVEDIDCSVEAQDRLSEARATTTATIKRTSQVTLSGLLNFIDGLWSSCGDERIIVFTTNNKDRLDPALLRPGRMDVHVHMSYCTPCGFTTLAANYLGITDHPLICEIKELMKNIMVTPAEVGEQLLKNEDPERALQDIIKFLLAKEKSPIPSLLETKRSFDDQTEESPVV